MQETQTASRRTTDAKKAAFLDGILRRLSVEAACATADISRRLPYHWKTTDPKFAAAWADAAADAEHLVNKRQVAEWTAELARLEAELSTLESELTEVAALAMAGDPDAIARRDDLRAQHQKVAESAVALRQAIASGEQHVARQAEAKAQAEREAAADESDELHRAQIEAAKEFDEAIARAEAAFSKFSAATTKRQSAHRRATGKAGRVAIDRQLMQALFHGAPTLATNLGVSRMLRPHAARLQELL